MQAVVTGAAGFIGRHLVDELIARGYRVTGIDRQPGPIQPGYEHHALDLSDEAACGEVAAIVGRADMVFHLAARPGVRERGPAIDEMRWRDNVAATRNLLSFVPEETPLVVTSSSSVYGGTIGGVPSREDDPLRPRGGYARSKVAMERICEERRAGGGLTAVIRPFTVAGEGQRPDMAFSMWMRALRSGLPIEIFGSKTRSRDITDVRDAVEGLIRAGERRINQNVNLGTGVGHSLIEMASALLDASGLDAEIVQHAVFPDEADATLADTRLSRELLGFVPTTDLTGLLARQLEAAERTDALVTV
ncbi:MAG: NAD-dependent epimerase/dehydratase family protein [Actinomycetota bacterium]